MGSRLRTERGARAWRALRWLAIGGLVGLGILLALLARPLPQAWFAPVGHPRVLDRHGVVIAERAIPERGRERWVELDQVSPWVVGALIASEDRSFRTHFGVDPRAVGRAFLANLQAGRVVQGGSTITQQTARLLAGRPPGLRGKGVEAWRALRLEAHLSKDEILTWYLNRAYFGRNAWGIEAAARAWFDETAASVSLAEAAALVALLPGPEALGPDRAPQEAQARRERVLDAMVALGFVHEEEAQRARAEPLQLHRPPVRPVAPHLAARVLTEDPQAIEIHTTLDAGLQREIEEMVREELDALQGRDVDHAAVLVARVSTGEVLAYVGSGDFHADDGQVDGVTALRSPGSTLKPFLFGLAFEQGSRPADVVPDLPHRWGTSHGTWSPENYSGRFRGPVRLREALASSTNVPAVLVLEQVGVATFMDHLQHVGVTFPERPAHYGLGLALGGGEASLEGLVTAYAGLARGGVSRPLRLRLDAVAGEETRFLAEEAAWLVTDILADPVARVPAFGRQGPLARPYPAAAKTGTSTGFRDNWTVGYTPDHVVGVWVGNFDARPMGDVSGVTGAGPLWARVMDRVSRGERRAFPPAPPALQRGTFCALSGLAAGPHCPHTVEDHVWVERAAPPPPCDWHLERCAVAWPSGYRSWAADQGKLLTADCPSEGPVAIAWPSNGARLYVDPAAPPESRRLILRPAAPPGARQALWQVNGEPVPAVGAGPLEASWTPQANGPHRVDLVVDGVAASPVLIHISGVDPAAPAGEDTGEPSPSGRAEPGGSM